ncbi:UNUSUAL FLORAL ORGANS-like protein [Drosera capensis]
MLPPGFTPCSTSNGLICWVSDEAGPKTLFLHNPLVGTLIQLPPALRPRLFPSIGLGITNTSIDITVAGDDMISPYAVKNLTTESFHIDAGGFYSIWGTSSALPRLCSLESGHMTYHDNRFYCMNYSPFSVLAYDVASNSWWKVQAPMRRFLRSPSLVEIDGKLMLVAAVEKSKLNVPKSLRVWCLQGCGTTWVEVERMPQQLYQQFSEVERGRGFDCIGQGEFVVILIRGFGVGVNKGVVFDMRRKRWMWMPPCPFVNSAGGEMQGFGYEPRLATPVTGLLDQLALPFQSSFNLA